MKMNKLTLGLIASTFALSASAADSQLTAAFKTIKDVTISQVAGREMVINGLYLTSGSTCTVTTPTTAANWAGDSIMLMASTGTSAPSANYGATAGATCATGTSIPGIYEIDGAAGADVTITLAAASSGGITFTPAGCAADYDGASDGDVCTPTAVGNTTITLADTADQTVSAGQGVPVAGKSRLVLAGTVVSSIGLSAASSYTVPFDITVTY